MGCLTNLKVKKVSFVSRGANRREFFLAKSADLSSEDVNNRNKTDSGGTIVRTEIKTKVASILKAERNVDKIVLILKEDKSLAVTDAEITEIQDFLSLMPPPSAEDAAALKKAQEEREALEKKAKDAEAENKTLADRLQKVEQDRHRDEIKKWLATECSHLNIKIDDAADRIIKAEAAGADVAQSLKDSFKGTSDTLKQNLLLKEYGTGNRGEADSVGGNLVADVRKTSGEIRKASEGLKESQAVIEAIKSAGGERYSRYREEFNRRAKASGAEVSAE